MTLGVISFHAVGVLFSIFSVLLGLSFIQIALKFDLCYLWFFKHCGQLISMEHGSEQGLFLCSLDTISRSNSTTFFLSKEKKKYQVPWLTKQNYKERALTLNELKFFIIQLFRSFFIYVFECSKNYIFYESVLRYDSQKLIT